MERKAEMNLRKPMFGVRWQSEARTPTPLWLGEGNSWSLHSPHGGGLMALLGMALLETAGWFWHKGTFSSQSGVALRFPPHSIPARSVRRQMHGVRWQSEERTPTPLWLGGGNSWPLHSPHGGGQTAMFRWRC